MNREPKSFPLTEVQWSYILGRKKEFKYGDVATHYYNEVVNEVDITRFEKALNRVIARHPMLHTVVKEDGTQYELTQYGYYNIKEYDVRNYGEVEKKAFLEQQRRRLSHYNYEAGTWPMFTFESVKLDDTHNQMFISIDLAIADASSIWILFNDLYAYYEDMEAELPELSVTFRQFVQTMEQEKETKRYQADREYWRNWIPTLPKGPELPMKRVRDTEKPRFQRMIHVFEAKEWSRIRKIFMEKGVIATTFLCQCYREVLAYWSQSNVFSMNLTTSNRGKMTGMEQVIGDFTSLTILPMPEETVANDFYANAKKLQRMFMDVYSHASYNGISVEREYSKYHNLQNEIPFPIVFTSMMGGKKKQYSKEFGGESIYSISQTPQVYLDCQVSEVEDVLVVSWDYPERQFEASMMEKMFAQFVQLIEEAGGVDGNVSHILRLPKKEKDMIMEYNQTKKEFPVTTLQNIWEKSVQMYPQNIAILDEGKAYTYQQAHEWVELYAKALRNKGVKAGDRVGIKGVKEARTVFCILACVKVGAVFIPIHPDYPQERVQYILHDSNARFYVEDKLAEDVGEMDPEVRYEVVSPNAETYIIYTSGSTGTPKGVVISHRQVCNTLYDINERFHITEKDRVMNISDFGFDLSIYDIFGSILAGASMVVGKEIRDIGNLMKTLKRDHVTVWNSVPSIFTLALDYLKNDVVPSVTTVFLSGDWIPLQTFEKMKHVFPNGSLVSLGGATEGSIWSIYYPVNEVKKEWKSIPYGYPLANQQCYVLDDSGNLCPHGVRGEIYLGGEGVAIGYTDEEQTKKSFIVHDDFGRIYKTGDMGIFEPEGRIRILGRIDQQVKMNGYRIECMEIEKEIEKHQSVSRAFVEVKEGKKNRRLVAYVVPNKEEPGKKNLSDSWLLAGKNAAVVPKEFYESANSLVDRLLEETSLENIKRVICELRDAHKITQPVTVTQFCVQTGVKELYQKLVSKWMHALVKEGFVTLEHNRFELGRLQGKTIEQMKELLEKLESQIQTDYERENLKFFSLCMLNAKKVLVGEQAVTELLFPEGNTDTAKSLYNSNPRSQFNNHVIASMVKEYVKEHAKVEKVSILEIGAGIGGTTEPVLAMLSPEDNLTYTYTDLSQFFTAQAKNKFADYPFMEYGIYNLDSDPQCQGHALESYDIIIAANVMHDASHIDYSLRNAFQMLKPQGILILLEVTKEFYALMTTVELLEGFSSYDDFRVEQGSPLLGKDQWRQRLSANGFRNINIFPEGDMDLGENVIVGQKENVSCFLTKELAEIKEHLHNVLPPYMVPTKLIQLDHMPIGNNGKINRKELPDIEEEVVSVIDYVKPQTKVQQEIYSIWSEILGYEEFGIGEDFFELGGDSLLMIRCIANLERIAGYHVESKSFLKNRTIGELAELVEQNLKERK